MDYDLDNKIIKVDVDNNDVEKYRRLVGVLDRMSGASEARRVKAREASLNQCAEHKHQAGQIHFIPFSLRQVVGSPPSLQIMKRQSRYSVVIQNDIMAHPSRLNSVIARAVDGSKFKLEWYHKNYLDHVYAVSKDNGDILEHYRYTAFGEVQIYNASGNQVATTQIDNHILWNTRGRDELTGYYMYKYRHYSAELGRWPSRDPIEERGGVNLYAFVGNEPVGRWDRLGMFDCSPCGNQCNKCFPNPGDKAKCIRACLTEKLKKNCYTKKRRGGGGGGGQNCRENPAQAKCKPKKKVSCIDRCLKRNYGSTVEFTDTLGLHSTVAVVSGLGVETLSRTADKKITNIQKHNKMTSRLLKKAGSHGHAHNAAKAASRAGAFKGALSKTGTVGTAVGFGSSVYSGAARAQCYVKCKGGWAAKLLPHIR